MHAFRAGTTLLLTMVMIGCSTDGRNGQTATDDVPEQRTRAGAQSVQADDSGGVVPDAPEPAARRTREIAVADRRTILFVGTSLTAGYGLLEDSAYPAIIQQRIDSAGLPYRVVNAGVSGETSAGARARLDWLLSQPFEVLVLETGANDMLRGTDLVATRENIRTIVERVRAERPDAAVVLVGMLAPPNLGRAYSERFARVYDDVAEEESLPLVPFLLEGVAGERSLNLPDGVHPNAAGQRILARNVWRILEPVLQARR